MEPNLSIADVIEQIHRLRSSGNTLNKKKVKETHPELMRNALFYFPSWDHALQSAE